MGYLMMKFWRMPGDLALTVKWHHTENRDERSDVESPELHKLIDIVYLANVIINKLKIGYSGHTIIKELSPKFLRSFNLDEENLSQLESNIREKYEQSCPSLLLLEND
jgi:HD-like signal output (HDOD) protein